MNTLNRNIVRGKGSKCWCCTGALLLDNTKGAGDSLAVRKHRRGCCTRHKIQTIHGAHSVVDVGVCVDDTNKDAGCAHRKLRGVGCAVFSENVTRNCSNSFITAMQFQSG